MTRKETGYTRNPLIARGIRKYSGAAAARKNGRWLKKWKKVEKPAAAPVVAKRAPKWYPTEHVPRPIPSRKKGKATHTTLRSSITPGTVLIILAGRFAGRRVVFLKQLPSGLLLVTGPYKVNGVPLRRINQAYVISTSTKIDLSKVTVPENVNDAFFKRAEAPKKKKTEEEFFAQKDEKKGTLLPHERILAQRAVDKALLATIKATPGVRSYLARLFTLSSGDFPHRMRF